MSREDRRKLSRQRRKARALEDALREAEGTDGKLSVFAQILQQWQGPLPPPAWLKEYDETVPGLANRIFACFEQQVSHRINIEGTVVNGNMVAQDRGQWFAFILALCILAFAFYLVATGNVGWGITTVLLDVGALAGLFIYGRERQKAERERKARSLLRSPE